MATENTVLSESVFTGGKVETDETMLITVTGTAATVDDNTAYPVVTQAGLTEVVTIGESPNQTVTFTDAIERGYVISTNAHAAGDQDGLTFVVEVDGIAAQTATVAVPTDGAVALAAFFNDILAGCTAHVRVVAGEEQVFLLTNERGAGITVDVTGGTTSVTFAAAAQVNTPDDIAAQMNAQLTECSVVVVGSTVDGQVQIVSDETGAEAAIVVVGGTGGLTWDAPVAGTGVRGPLTVVRGTLIARNTLIAIMVPMVPGGGNGTGTSVGILDDAITVDETAVVRCRVARAGVARRSKIVIHTSAIAPTDLQLDTLIANSNITPVESVDIYRTDI